MEKILNFLRKEEILQCYDNQYLLEDEYISKLEEDVGKFSSVDKTFFINHLIKDRKVLERGFHRLMEKVEKIREEEVIPKRLKIKSLNKQLTKLRTHMNTADQTIEKFRLKAEARMGAIKDIEKHKKRIGAVTYDLGAWKTTYICGNCRDFVTFAPKDVCTKCGETSWEKEIARRITFFKEDKFLLFITNYVRLEDILEIKRSNGNLLCKI